VKLHRLRLTNFRGITDRNVSFPPSGVIVLEGDNEVGKTSMIDALDLLLEEKDSSTKARVKGIKPVSADTGSAVEAEISSGPYRFVYRKQFNKTTGTTLTIQLPTAEQLTGVPAHERVLQMLGTTMDTDLWKALRVMQAEKLTQANLSESGALASALDKAAGTAGHPESNDLLIAAVEQEHLTYFTKTRKPTGQYKALSDALDLAQAHADAALNALAEIADDVEKYDSFTRDLSELRGQQETANEEFQNLSDELLATDELRRKVSESVRAAVSARQEFERARQDSGTRSELAADVAARSRSIDELQSRITQKLEDHKTTEKQVTDQQDRVEQLTEAADAARIAAAIARNDVTQLQDIDEFERLRDRLSQIARFVVDIETAQRSLATTSVDASLLEKIEEASTALNVATALQQASAAQLLLSPLSDDVIIEIDGQRLHLENGAPEKRSVAKPIEILIPEVLRLTLTPAADAHSLATKVNHSRDALTGLLIQAQAADISDARILHELRRVAENQLHVTKEGLQQLLGEDDTSELRTRQIVLEEQIEAYRKSRVQQPAIAEDIAAARVLSNAAEAGESGARLLLDQANAGLTSYVTERNIQQVEIATLESTFKAQNIELTSAVQKLNEAREKIADGDLAARTKETETAVQNAELVEQQLAAELATADPDSLQSRQTNAAQLTKRLSGDIDARTADATAVKARLEVTGSQGRQDQHDEKKTALHNVDQKYSAAKARAHAAQLLHDVMQRHRDEAKKEYVKPFKDNVTALGRIVYGSDFQVEINSDLHIITRTMDSTTLPYESLSTGAKEQLAIMTRLACAAIVDEADGVPVIIDDALGYSDPGRLRRLSAVFGEAAARSQVILMTCSPERYRAIGSATVIKVVRS
jgi:DNA repair exonuclease SbcCD ATPase subunit